MDVHGYTAFWSENVKGKGHLGDLGVNGLILLFKGELK
jgi:hypothetical protein